MKKTKCLTLMLLGGLLIAAPGSSRGSVTMSVQNYSSLDLIQVAGSVNGTEMPNAYIGIYSFNISGTALNANNQTVTFPSTIQSICLSPLGDLTTGSYTYKYESFAAANAGINPTSWVTGPGGQEWGIQNANYLWQTFSTAVETANDPTASAALAMAMYAALYNSTGYGQAAVTGTGFAPNFVGDGTEKTDYDNDLTALNSYAGSPLAVGYVFVPTDTSAGGPSGQEFIILATSGSVLGPVPEPTTIIAGATLLLPFGASTLRNLRKKNAA